MALKAYLDLFRKPSLVAASTEDLRLGTEGAGGVVLAPRNSPGVKIREVESTVVGAAAATVSASNLIPAGSTCLGVTVEVTSTFSNASLTSMNIGDGTDADRWGAAIALVAGTKTTQANFTAGGAIFYAANTSVVLTGVVANFAANGIAKVKAYLLDVLNP